MKRRSFRFSTRLLVITIDIRFLKTSSVAALLLIQNALSFCEKREQKYLRIVARYEKKDVVRMAELLAHVVNGLDDSPGDFLGQVFMQLELGDKYRGQFFTPYGPMLTVMSF